MRAWQLASGWGIDKLRRIERPCLSPGAGEVVVNVRAASLNFRDLVVLEGKSTVQLPLIPCSDGAGIVSAVGEGVSRVGIGDRVCATFFQGWLDGHLSAESRKLVLGGTLDGVLQDEILLNAEGVVRFPDHLSFVEAATLPCAALTAWRALMVEGRLRAGQTVLTQGTGGVSMFALLFAKMAGAIAIVTSGSDEKLDRARRLGADHLVNYRRTPRWASAVMEITAGRGADHVIEIGGKETLDQSVQCAAVGGHLFIIGLVTGFAQQLDAVAVFRRNLHVIGISVGNRADFDSMAQAIAAHRLRPAVDRVFPFDEAPQALRYLRDQNHFGKICIEF